MGRAGSWLTARGRDSCRFARRVTGRPAPNGGGIAYADGLKGIRHATGAELALAFLEWSPAGRLPRGIAKQGKRRLPAGEVPMRAAQQLAREPDFAGTVHFIFQPAEEGLGGARVMIEEGLFDKFNCDAVYGMHNMPGIATGTFAIRTGAMLASSDSWEVTFKGSGGHGAMPDRGTDPTFVAAQFIVAVQGIVGRNVPPAQAAVLSVGHIHAGTPGSPNVIPSEVLIKGTARSFSADVRNLLERRLAEVADGELARLVQRGAAHRVREAGLARLPLPLRRDAGAEIHEAVALEDLCGGGGVYHGACDRPRHRQLHAETDQRSRRCFACANPYGTRSRVSRTRQLRSCLAGSR